MTVKQLMNELRKYPEEMPVLLYDEHSEYVVCANDVDKEVEGEDKRYCSADHPFDYANNSYMMEDGKKTAVIINGC